jgi:magnesium transporter
MFAIRRKQTIQKYSAEDLTLYYDDVKDHMDKAFEILEESKELLKSIKIQVIC